MLKAYQYCILPTIEQQWHLAQIFGNCRFVYNRSLENIIRRTGAELDELLLLIRCSAFRFTGPGKKELLRAQTPVSAGDTLFAKEPPAGLAWVETSWVQDVYGKIGLLGFSVSNYPFALVKSTCPKETAATSPRQYEGRVI